MRCRWGNPWLAVDVESPMTTHLSRRTFVTGLGFAAAAYGWAKDFWNDKKPSDWTEDEIQQMLTRSPWAKEASIFDSATHKGVSSAPYAGGIYGSRRYESPDGKSLPTVRGSKGWGATVRWESALPVRDAMKTAKSADADKNYIIALVGEMPAASVPSDDDDVMAALAEFRCVAHGSVLWTKRNVLKKGGMIKARFAPGMWDVE